MTNTTHARVPALSIALMSAAALAYEVLLMRLFSIIQWHHFAAMIISMALLGYGASGTVLSLNRQRLLPHYASVFVACAVLFAVTTGVCFQFAQQLPFNAEEVLWDWQQPLWLLLIYLLLAVPFLFAATCTALSFARFGEAVPRVYAMDLLGAGAGSVGAVAVLFWLLPQQALQAVSMLALTAAAMAWWQLQLRPRPVFLLLLLSSLLVMFIPAPALQISPYKGLPQALQIAGTRIVAERSSPLGQLSVVASEQVPWRHAPGLSLLAQTEPPPQLAVFTDGDGMTVINHYRGDNAPLAFLDQMTSALPYHLQKPQRALILGAGGGSDVLQARYHGVPRVDAVELNPQMAQLVQRDFADYAGPLYDGTAIRLHVAEARGFVSDSAEHYDLIQLAALDSFSASAAGLRSLHESYLYTVEALQTFFQHLTPGGYLALTSWVKLPPRDTLKLVATAIDVLRAEGVADPAQHLALIRSWQTSTLLLKRGPFTDMERESLRRFCQERSFDLAYYPGMSRAEANRYNVLAEPFFYDGTLALLGPHRERFLAQYKFDLQPATDDRPYFFHFFKWSGLQELLALRQQGGMALLEWGYLLLVATALQALLASIVLIVLPLLRLRAPGPRLARQHERLQVLGYFFLLGIAFLFVEIAFLQKLVQFLHHPLYATSLGLATFLIFAGLGSWLAQGSGLQAGPKRSVAIAIAAIALLCIGYPTLLDPLFHKAAAWPVLLKALLAVAIIAPLAFCMGLPFPLGMARLSANRPDLVPWAWAVNGCASVLSAVLAALLAIQFGFSSVVLIAAVLYGGALALFPDRSPAPAKSR